MKTRLVRCFFIVFIPALVAISAAAPAHADQTRKKPDTYFLVAQPDLPDPLFQQTVILMLPSTDTPLVVGVIVNKPTTMKLGDLFPHIAGLKKQPGTAYFGGPVDVTTPMAAFHASRASGQSTAVFKNVYITMEPDVITGLLKGAHSDRDVRVYLGRAQWTEDQLHDEMMENSWYTVPSDPNTVFSTDPDKIWSKLVQQAQLIRTSGRTVRPLPELLPVMWPQTGDPMISATTGAIMPDFR